MFAIGRLNIKCYRSSQKESAILDLVKGDSRFMQGRTVQDSEGNSLKIIDFIPGPTLYDYLQNLTLTHKEYFYNFFPGILENLVGLLQGIRHIHDNGFYHGDLRNDHILIEDGSGLFRLIDFDLNQDFSDYDIWSLGNILLFSAGLGEHTLRNIAGNPEIPNRVIKGIGREDTSAFFKHRIINLKKLFPYIPAKLNRVLMRFSFNTTEFYETVTDILLDMEEILIELKG